jgi:hypothetical protein
LIYGLSFLSYSDLFFKSAVYEIITGGGILGFLNFFSSSSSISELIFSSSIIFSLCREPVYIGRGTSAHSISSSSSTYLSLAYSFQYSSLLRISFNLFPLILSSIGENNIFVILIELLFA